MPRASHIADTLHTPVRAVIGSTLDDVHPAVGPLGLKKLEGVLVVVELIADLGRNHQPAGGAFIFGVGESEQSDRGIDLAVLGFGKLLGNVDPQGQALINTIDDQLLVKQLKCLGDGFHEAACSALFNGAVEALPSQAEVV